MCCEPGSARHGLSPHCCWATLHFSSRCFAVSWATRASSPAIFFVLRPAALLLQGVMTRRLVSPLPGCPRRGSIVSRSFAAGLPFFGQARSRRGVATLMSWHHQHFVEPLCSNAGLGFPALRWWVRGGRRGPVCGRDVVNSLLADALICLIQKP